MEFSIQQVAAAAGVTSRTLRHYDAIGLLPAHRGPANGYRTYSGEDLVRLQRILLLRELGLGLPEIARVLDGETDDVSALRSHLAFLRSEQDRLDRRIASVQRTIAALDEEETMDVEDMFDGFDHRQHKDEVVDRWGAQAYEDSDRWWRGLGDADKQAFADEAAAISAAWRQARQEGLPVDDPKVQEIAARHVRWIQRGWAGKKPSAEAVTGLALMYVADERFARNYGGVEGASYVRDALTEYARSM
jgi:DNA-binding transcriptional MerR regulator